MTAAAPRGARRRPGGRGRGRRRARPGRGWPDRAAGPAARPQRRGRPSRATRPSPAAAGGRRPGLLGTARPPRRRSPPGQEEWMRPAAHLTSPRGRRAGATVRGFDRPGRVDKLGSDHPQEVPMRFKSGFLVGLSAGYVLGTKAGQERYQQIVDATSKLRENPGVQRLTGEVNKTVNVSKDRVAETAAAKADQAKEAVTSKVGGNAGSSSTSATSGSNL